MITDKCRWTASDRRGATFEVMYDTECGKATGFILKVPDGFLYCPYCGKLIKFVQEESEEE